MFFYSEEGNENSDTLVFLHGFLGCHLDFDPYVKKLKDSYRCISYDLPGHGLSSFAHAKEFLNALPRDSHLIGYSMGGRIALELYLSEPNNFRSLTLFSTNPGIETDILSRVQFEMLWQEKFRSDPLEKSIREWYDLDLFKGFSIPPYRYKQSPENIAKAMEEYSIVKRGSFWDDISQLTKRTLWIFGSEDKKYQLIAKRLKSCNPYHIQKHIEGCNHVTHMVEPTQIINHMRHYYEHIN